MKTIMVKGRIIGGTKVMVSVGLVGSNTEDILAEAKALADLHPDLIEWRVDYFNELGEEKKVIETLKKLREIVYDYPIIFTCRDSREGGASEIGNEQKVAIIQAAIRTGLVDFVDVELLSGSQHLKDTITLAHQYDTYVIVSQHDFKQTPSIHEMIETLCSQQRIGADIAKVAVMPQQPQDVLRLLEATLQFKEKHATIPVISMAMSQLGVISRVAGAVFGSAITFAAHQVQSAPGQIPLAKLRLLLDIIEPLEGPFSN